jgi:hypothetical protein
MCVVSMVMDYYADKWQGQLQQPSLVPVLVPQITQAEVDEFRRLLERARKYDADHNEPDCELDSKRQRVRELAEKLGLKVEFV